MFVVLFKRAVGLFREVFLAPLLHALNDNFGFCNGIQQIFITGYWVSGSELSATEVMKIDDSCVHSGIYLVILMITFLSTCY